MSRRRSTVHDAAALRLHPSGERVPLAKEKKERPKNPVVAAKNRNPTLALINDKGQWFATDAGGKGRVTKRLRVGEGDEGKEKPVSRGAEAQETALSPGDDAPVKVFKDSRANQRVTFENDFTFLSDNLADNDSMPSSDLLKCIHYCASEHYAARGQLSNSAAKYRKEKKQKRQRRIQAGSKSSDEEGGQSDGDMEEPESNGSAEESASSFKRNFKRKNRAKVKSKSSLKDMYRAFDGSALVCIGMLLQSHISSTLENIDGHMLEDSQDGLSTINDVVDDADDAIGQSRKRSAAREEGGHNKERRGHHATQEA